MIKYYTILSHNNQPTNQIKLKIFIKFTKKTLDYYYSILLLQQKQKDAANLKFHNILLFVSQKLIIKNTKFHRIKPLKYRISQSFTEIK